MYKRSAFLRLAFFNAGTEALFCRSSHSLDISAFTWTMVTGDPGDSKGRPCWAKPSNPGIAAKALMSRTAAVHRIVFITS
jgi:hypothetical protein